MRRAYAESSRRSKPRGERRSREPRDDPGEASVEHPRESAAQPVARFQRTGNRARVFSQGRNRTGNRHRDRANRSRRNCGSRCRRWWSSRAIREPARTKATPPAACRSKSAAPRVRMACAEARHALVEQRRAHARARMQSRVTADGGLILLDGAPSGLDYWQVAREIDWQRPVTGTAPFAAPAELKRARQERCASRSSGEDRRRARSSTISNCRTCCMDA